MSNFIKGFLICILALILGLYLLETRFWMPSIVLFIPMVYGLKIMFEDTNVDNLRRKGVKEGIK